MKRTFPKKFPIILGEQRETKVKAKAKEMSIPATALIRIAIDEFLKKHK